MPNLTGVDLQRAITEKKGWKVLTNCQPLHGIRGADTHSSDIPEWDDDERAAHALLGELVAEGWEWTGGYEHGDGHWCQAWKRDHTRLTQISGHPDFCTAVGNLYLECVG